MCERLFTFKPRASLLFQPLRTSLFIFLYLSKVIIFYFQLKKKSFLFIHYPKASTKPTSEFSCSRLIGFNFKLDFFGRLPLYKRCFIIGFPLAIFQKNEHSLVAIEHTIYFPLVMICAKKRAKKDGNHCSWLFCEAFFVQSHY